MCDARCRVQCQKRISCEISFTSMIHNDLSCCNIDIIRIHNIYIYMYIYIYYVIICHLGYEMLYAFRGSKFARSSRLQASQKGHLATAM